MPHTAAELLATLGYPAYLVLFLATALGSPLTEDLLLLAGGYLAAVGIFSWPVVAPLALAGVLGADIVLYSLGRKLRSHSLRGGWVRRFVRPGRLRIATRWFARFGDWLVVLARFVPGTRVVVFVTAGLRGMPVARFLALDGVAALIWVPALLFVGGELGEHIGNVSRFLHWVQGRVVWLVVLAAGIALARQAWIAAERRRFGPSDAEP